MDSQNTNFAGTRANDSFDNSSSNYNNNNMNNSAGLSDNYSSSNTNYSNMNSSAGLTDNNRNSDSNYNNMSTSNADYNNMDNTNSTFSDNTLNKTDATGYAADNNRSDFNDGVSQSNTTPSTNTDSFDRDNTTRETASREFDSENRDSTTSDVNQDDVPKKGIAGVIHSNFGADKTTTSTFEKSQGEKYGENFDETGAKIKGRFSVDETAAASGSATGGGDYSMGGKQSANAGMDSNVPNKHDGTQKESFGQKLKDKAEGMMHRHHHE